MQDTLGRENVSGAIPVFGIEKELPGEMKPLIVK